MFKRSVVIGLLVFLGQNLSAEPQEAHHEQIELSTRLREALAAEMVAIDAGISSLASSIARGDWPAVRSESRKIHDSFILQQELSEAEREELHRALPAGFVALDTRFHQHAKQLAHVAEKGDGELAVFYFNKLIEGCVDCHATYAPGAFPGLAPAAAVGHAH
jgi:hypothetical protein